MTEQRKLVYSTERVDLTLFCRPQTRSYSNYATLNRKLLQHFGVPVFELSSCNLRSRCSQCHGIKTSGIMIPSGSVLTSLAASTFAGLSRFGVSEERRDMTLTSCGVMSHNEGGESQEHIRWSQRCERASIVHRRLHIHIDPHQDCAD